MKTRRMSDIYIYIYTKWIMDYRYTEKEYPINGIYKGIYIQTKWWSWRTEGFLICAESVYDENTHGTP